jgi:ribosomal protein L29
MKFKEIKILTKAQREKKLKELKLELIKSKSANAKATGKSKAIRKIIARIHTFNAQEGGLETK